MLKLNSGAVAEFASGDTLGVALGGTGATAASQARINLGISNTVTIPFTLENGTTDDIVLDGTGAVTTLSGITNIDLSLNGNFTITGTAGWRDLTSEINVKGSGANNPSWATFRNGISAYSFSASTMTECWMVFHIDHDYKPGSDMYFHTHWSTTGTNTGVVRWGFEYTVAKGHGQSAFGATQTVYVEQAGSGTAYQHMVAETTAISSAEFEVDALILMRIFRDSAHVNDTQTGVAFLFTADCHYQADRFATKNRSPNFYT